jgi:site-specific DNA-methyltransferase (adenine-specific)
MQKLKDEGKQIDSVVTDPPYHLTSIVERYGKDGSAPAKDKDGLYQRQARGFMGKEWDGGDIAFRTDTWKLAYDLLKPGGYLLAFSASRNYHRMAVAIEDAGFEIRDQIMWIYGSGFPKSLNIGKAIDKKLGNEREVTGKGKPMSSLGVMHDDDWQSDSEYNETKGNSEYEGWGTALKPAHEPIVMARKPLEGTNIDNVLKYGTGAINIDGCRIQGNDTGGERKITTRKSRDENNVWTDDNSGMKQEENHFADADPKGRYPANVMHDGSDVVQDIFPQTSKSVSTKRTRKTIGSFGMPNDTTPEYDDEGTAARYFYCPKTSAEERNRGNLDFKGNQGDGSKHNKVAMRLNTHPTVKPQELMKYLCRLVTPKGGVVLDPFMGSGSTGMAAKDEGFDFIGIEKEKEYFEIAEARIKVSSPLMEFM